MPETIETPVTSVPLGPIGERDRILSLDALRGFALLGIFFVNMPFFAGPFASLFGPIGGEDATTAEVAAWGFIKIFCEYKFVSLFSLLFGMGLVVIMTRAKASGRPYVSVYLRRLFILAVFGFAHVFFLWYGDILFFYAGCGVILLALSMLSGRALVKTALGIFILAGLVMGLLGGAQVGMAISAKNAETSAVVDAVADTVADTAAVADTDAVTDTVADTDAVADTDTDADPDADTDADPVADPVADTDADTAADPDPAANTDAPPDPTAPLDREALHDAPFKTLFQLMFTDPMFLFGDRMAEIERVAYGEGPFRTAASLRIFTWGFILVQVIFSLAWRIIAMFAAGAGLMKLDFFAPHRRSWHRRMCAIGLGVGLPLEMLAFWLTAGGEFGASWRWLAGEFVHYFGSMTLCFGYVGAVVLIVQSGALALVVRGFASVGRMALTNYIMQSVIAGYVMYSWGLAQFDSFGRPQMLALVAVIFSGQIALSVIWLKVFRMGPLEFVWRTLTYLRPPRLLRERDAGSRAVIGEEAGAVESAGAAPVTLAPVGEADRIVALDVLRGVAVLGILVMNIQSFAMIGAAYMNPTAYGDLTGANRVVWLVNHLLADQKFMAIFSMLFGAGIALMSERAERSGRPGRGVHYRRMLWLLLFGLLHAHLLWFGDILYFYAICGMVIWPMRRLKSGLLLALAAAAFVIPIGMSVMGGWSMQFWPPEAVEQQMVQWAPSAEDAARELEIYRDGWLTQMTHRAPTALVFETMIFALWGAWRAGALMLVGIVLYRTGVLTGRASTTLYAMMAAVGLVVGVGLTGFGVTRHFDHGWSLEYSMFYGSQFNYVGSLFGSLAWIGVVMLVYRALAGNALLTPLAAVGRAALSCYLLQTIICTTLFYGHGFGLFGKLERLEQMYVVLGVWAFLLVAAPLWLAMFRYGPFEWLWRSLAYWRRQPMRR